MFFLFFVSVITDLGSKTVTIFFNSILFEGKVNLVGALGWPKFKIVFKSAGNNETKIKKKLKFVRKISF